MRFHRLCKPSDSRSFFLFGARGTGKSTLLHELLDTTDPLWIDLLDPDTEDRYARHPASLLEQVRARHRDQPGGMWEWIVIDEIQKTPRLLDVVHAILESREFTPPKFALTGSSARKLRHGGANLLAGRAFVQHLHPLTFLELGDAFDLERVLNWGSLPEIFQFQDEIVPGTFAFGRAFEHFIVLEMMRLNDAFRLDYRFSHLRTKDGVEIDLIIERPGEPTALVEIKSSDRTTRHDARHLVPFLGDISGAVGFCISLDPLEREIEGIRHLPWRTAFAALGLAP